MQQAIDDFNQAQQIARDNMQRKTRSSLLRSSLSRVAGANRVHGFLNQVPSSHHQPPISGKQSEMEAFVPNMTIESPIQMNKHILKVKHATLKITRSDEGKDGMCEVGERQDN